ncbi:hypothetical protein CBM2631_B50092 [Cupriavidus taiwanensis]|nr:hypothetical protein CBM2588_B30137 [Cupriavidus taiwanensis]SPA20980.1 hypothetical protein CBM2631_B50092 [Cupriavidus taiwanensis]
MRGWAWPTTRAIGLKPRLSAIEAFVSTNAAATSEIELELAAVTVPSFLKAGFSDAILSTFALSGCSSSATVGVAPFLSTIDIEAVSHAKLPSRIADWARCVESTAHPSCASRSATGHDKFIARDSHDDGPLFQWFVG